MPSNPLSELIDKFGKYLKEQQSPTQTLPYESFAAPQNQVFNNLASTFYRPQFEYNQLQPFHTQASNNAAPTDQGLAGNYGNFYRRQLNGLESGYNTDLFNAKNSFNGTVNNLYQNQIKNMGNSPTFGTTL